MKKIKLLTPILGLTALSSVVVPLSSCSCKQEETTRAVGITESLSNLASAKSTTKDNGDIEITVSAKDTLKRVEVVDRIIIGEKVLNPDEWSFDMDSQIITITKAILDKYAGNISVVPGTIDYTPVIQSISVEAIKTTYTVGEKFNKSSDVKVTGTYKKGDKTITQDDTEKSTCSCTDWDLTQALTEEQVGSHTINVVCEGKEASYGVTVEPAPTGKVKVTFNTGEGGPTVQPQEIESGGTATRPDDPQKADYLFMDWYEEDTFTTKFDFSTPITADKVLYGKYEAASSGILYYYDAATDGYWVTDEYPGSEASTNDDTTLVIPATHDGTVGVKNVVGIGTPIPERQISPWRQKDFTALYMPNTLQYINEQSFVECRSLKTVNSETVGECNLPTSLKVLGGSCFANCDCLTKMCLPETIQQVGDMVGWETQMLKTENNIQYLPSENNEYFAAVYYESESNDNNVVLNDNCEIIGDNLFQGAEPAITSVKIPSKVRIIGGWAFASNGELTKVYYGDEQPSDGAIVLPETLESIGESAFESCEELTSADMSKTQIKVLPDCVFYDVPLTSITFSSVLEEAGQNVTTQMPAVTLPNTMKRYLWSSFIYNEVPATITCSSPYITEVNNVKYELDGNGNKVAALFMVDKEQTSVEIDSSITKIHKYAFCESQLTDVTIPNGVTAIEENAFIGCGNLATVTIGTSVETIGDYAFEGCALGQISIPKSVKSIGMAAFANNDLSSGVTFENDCALEIIDNRAFDSTSLPSITLPKSLKTLGYKAFCYCPLTSITFEQGCQLTNINWFAFKGCDQITSIEIPASIKNIGWCAFQGCSALQTVTFVTGSKLTAIESYAFAETAFTSITLPETLKTIGDYAFAQSAIGSITIPAVCETIGEEAFSESQLATITFADNAQLKSIGKKAFNYTSIASITIPDTVESIGDQAFQGTALTSLTIPASVKSLGIDILSECEGTFTSISFPSGSKWTIYDTYYDASLEEEVTVKHENYDPSLDMTQTLLYLKGGEDAESVWHDYYWVKE